jgi:hypothetical protein
VGRFEKMVLRPAVQGVSKFVEEVPLLSTSLTQELLRQLDSVGLWAQALIWGAPG